MYDAVKLGSSQSASSFHFEFTTVKGYFLPSEDETDAKDFDFQNFGLIERAYDTDREDDVEKSQWHRFRKYVRHMNSKSRGKESYKVLFIGRHGQGWHNIAETKYDTTAWDGYWSMLDGADGITWADAKLTELGESQAKKAGDLWKNLLPKGIPVPETYYVSPLTRALQTADLTFKTLDLPKDRPYNPIVKELLREVIGVHTCNRRNTASFIHQTFPHVKFEPHFSEEDTLWLANSRESRKARRYRLAQLLDDIFLHDDGVFLSLTSHFEAISSILEVVSHRCFSIPTGAVVPVLVKAEKVEGERVKPAYEPSEGLHDCPSL